MLIVWKACIVLLDEFSLAAVGLASMLHTLGVIMAEIIPICLRSKGYQQPDGDDLSMTSAVHNLDYHVLT